MGELGDKLRTALAATLEPGESLEGACVATQTGLFKGRQVAIGATDRRLIVQGMNRRFEPDGAPVSLPPDRIAAADAEDISGGWPNLAAALMDRAAVTLKLKTTDGEKLKLMMMRGTGKLGGGDDQRQGVEALANWFTRHTS